MASLLSLAPQLRLCQVAIERCWFCGSAIDDLLRDQHQLDVSFYGIDVTSCIDRGQCPRCGGAARFGRATLRRKWRRVLDLAERQVGAHP